MRALVSRKAYGLASLFSLTARSCSVFAEYIFWPAVATASESRLRLVQSAGFCMEKLYHGPWRFARVILKLLSNQAQSVIQDRRPCRFASLCIPDSAPSPSMRDLSSRLLFLDSWEGTVP